MFNKLCSNAMVRVMIQRWNKNMVLVIRRCPINFAIENCTFVWKGM